MANVDITAGFEQIVLVATRVEKRLGVLSGNKKKSKRSDSESDSDSDFESESNDEESDGDEESDSDSSGSKKKKKKSKKGPSSKSKDGKKKNKKVEDNDHQSLKRLKRLGLSPPVSPEKLFCVICDRAGHATENCHYNPNCRGKFLPHISERNFQASPPQVNQVMPARQGRVYNGPPRNAQQRQN